MKRLHNNTNQRCVIGATRVLAMAGVVAMVAACSGKASASNDGHAANAIDGQQDVGNTKTVVLVAYRN